jgi:hypothetical protein
LKPVWPESQTVFPANVSASRSGGDAVVTGQFYPSRTPGQPPAAGHTTSRGGCVTVASN